MSFRGPELLGPQDTLDGFDCGSAPLNDWLITCALANQRTGASRTWVVLDDDSGRVVGYYASATASIMRSAATTRAARNQPEDISAILLARLAIDREFQGQGLASALLKHFILKALEVAEVVGARILLVHAQDEEARAYLHHDFQPSPIDDRTLMRVITDLI